MKTHQLPTCPACGSNDCRTFDLGEGKLLKKCQRCETVSALEYAAPEEIYTDGYFFGESEWGVGFDVRHPVFQEFLAGVANRRFDLIEGVTGGPGSILDVGSGTGEVLLAGQKRGWSVQGVEPEQSGAQVALDRGVPVEVAMLEESGLPERSWDVVSAFHVLEHMTDSRSFIRMLARWAKPGGHVVIEVPNFGSVQRRRTRHGWVDLRPLQHIVHYTPATLERTLLAGGVEPELVRTPVYLGPPQDLDQAIGDLARGPRFRRLLEPLASKPNGGGPVPNRAGWAILRTLEALYDRAGVGTVVFSISRVQ